MGCFQVMYDSRVVIYERKLFIRLATEHFALIIHDLVRFNAECIESKKDNFWRGAAIA